MASCACCCQYTFKFTLTRVDPLGTRMPVRRHCHTPARRRCKNKFKYDKQIISKIKVTLDILLIQLRRDQPLLCIPFRLFRPEKRLSIRHVSQHWNASIGWHKYPTSTKDPPATLKLKPSATNGRPRNASGIPPPSRSGTPPRERPHPPSPLDSLDLVACRLQSRGTERMSGTARFW